MVEVTVVICTRNRPQRVHRVLDALERQSEGGFETVVVDQSDVDDPTLDGRPGVRVVRGSGVGVSKGRNAGLRATATPWMLTIDDDCVPGTDWVQGNRRQIARHPDVAVIWSRIEAGLPAGAGPDFMPLSVFPVARERRVRGRWARPADMGMGAAAAVRSDWARRIGGWDERLGAGSAEFPGGEDMDFAWRLFQAGATALLSPHPCVVHEQWRTGEQVVALTERYTGAWAAMCVKHAKLGDPLGAAWLYGFGVKDAARLSLSPLRRRSRLRLRCALARWRGLAHGTSLAARYPWQAVGGDTLGAARRAPAGGVTVVICTLDRPRQLARALDALERQTVGGFAVVVVDAGDAPDPALLARSGVRVLAAPGTGLSAAKNLGWHATRTRWMVCLDDDCVPDCDWLEQLFAEIDRHPGIAMVWSRIDIGEVTVARTQHSPDHSLAPFERTREVRGRWVTPMRMGLAVAAIDVDWVRRVGGWDERLGPGAPVFAGAEDIDFNWRLLRAGGRALVTANARVVHEQLRRDDDLVAISETRSVGWAGMCIKHVKLGDVAGGAWLYFFGLHDALRMSLSPLRRRSRLRLALALAKWRGLARGTLLAARHSWAGAAPAPRAREQPVELTVVICTRNRAEKLHRALDALERQTDRDFAIVIVDQSDVADGTIDERRGVRTVVRDSGVGISPARNAGRRATRTPWMLCLDDDCVPERDWVETYRDAIARHPGVAVVWGRMDPAPPAPGSPHDAMGASAFAVARERLVAGRWIRPLNLGLGVGAFSCDWLERIGGWDERLGAGNPVFPGSEDSDIAWRLYQAGASALLSPRPRVVHESWRDDGEILAQIESYTTSWAGMCVKHARLGDPLGAAWLYAFCVKDAARMSLSPLRRRSRLRLRCAIAKWRGLARGTRLGLQRSWR